MKKYILLIVMANVFVMATNLRGAENLNDQKERDPDRVEQKTYSKISDVKIDHKYGNIIIKESTLKDVKLEIHYFDTRNQKASCDILTKNNVLVVNTKNSSGNGSNQPKINYIISLPKDVSLAVTLKYGNLKAAKIQSQFTANASYSNLDIESFVGKKTEIILRYGNLAVGEAQDLSVSLSYSDFSVKKAKTIDLSGRYNKIKIGDVYSILPKSSAYNSYSIESISILDANMKYDKVYIDNLLSTLNISCAYTDVAIGVNSPKVKQISIDGSYSDIIIQLDTKISADVESETKYGDLIISKVHTVKYTEDTKQNSRVSKKAHIGTKAPTLKIKTSNKYSDIKIK